MARSLWAQNLCLPKICWTQNIGVNLELKENLELECGPAQPNLFISIVVAVVVHAVVVVVSCG